MRKTIFILYSAIFIDSLGFGIIFPLLPFYARSFQASETVIGFLAASFAIAQFIFSPLWGKLSDRYGRKPIIALALFGFSVCFISFALAENLTGLFASRFLQGVFAAAAIPTAKAFIADLTGEKERTTAMGRAGAALSLGFIFGPAFGGILAQDTSTLPFWLAAGLSLLNFFFVLFLLPNQLPNHKKDEINERTPEIPQSDLGPELKSPLLPYFAMIFLWSYGVSNNQAAIPLFGMEKLNLSPSLIGWLFAISGIISVSVQGFFLGKASQKFKEEKIVKTGLLVMAVGLFLMALAGSFFFLAASMAVLAVGSALSRPTLNSLISKLTNEGQGATLGKTMSFEASGRILGPLTGGFLFQRFGGFGPFWTAAALIIVFLLLNKKARLSRR